MLSITARKSLIPALAALAQQVSLHTADPGSTGANEVRGEFYQQQSVYWSETGSNAVTVLFVVPKCIVTHVGYWQGAEFQFGTPTQRTRNEDGDSCSFAVGSLQLTLEAS